jgi:hypothetical protein
MGYGVKAGREMTGVANLSCYCRHRRAAAVYSIASEPIKTVSDPTDGRTRVGLSIGRSRSRPTREVSAYMAEGDKARESSAFGKLETQAKNGVTGCVCIIDTNTYSDPRSDLG